jgi:2-polyprenyl-3-methyl-5-hydroxy-6-metoxy-1,4-benzoquinol methylase
MSRKTSTGGKECTRCNLCGADDTILRFHIPVREDQQGVYAQDIWDIVQCNRCGLTYTNPRPDADALTAYYTFHNEWDYQFIQNWFVENADLQRPTWRRFLRILSRFAPSGRLLDVGCGAGTFLIEAQKAGFEGFGQEIAPYFVEYGREQHNLQILEGELKNLNLARHSFDVITAFDVIEHHPDPKSLLAEICLLLKPGGIIFVSTHDIGNFFARHYGARWRYLNPLGHLTYFTRQTLMTMLRQTGFEVLKVGGIHTIDTSMVAETLRKLTQVGQVLFLRALMIKLYKPLVHYCPRLTQWEITIKGASLNHKKLLMRVGNQIIMDDDMIIVARTKR